MQRFDEIELATVPVEPEPLPPDTLPPPGDDAPRFRRLLALLVDLSLFVASALALTPLLPIQTDWIAIASLGGFLVVLSFYYFTGCWMLWGKTIGGAIFDVRVVAEAGETLSFRNAAIRWAAVYLSLLTGGIGFALAALPWRKSLPDLMSHSRCVA